MKRLAYPMTMTPDEVDGGFVVTFRDVPEAITQGDTVEECLMEAADCLEEAIAGRIDDGLEIPKPSKARKGEKFVPVPVETAMQAVLYLAMKEAGISKVELAQRLHAEEKEVRHILDLHHSPKALTIEHALSALGKRVELHVV